MPGIRHEILKWLSAGVWYVGAVVLVTKGAGWLLEAAALRGPAVPAAVAVVAIGLGLLRGRTVFRRAAVKNLERIRALETPRLHHVFRPLFFLALAAMLAAVLLFGWLARTGYPGMVIVGGLDLVIGTSLLTGATVFWTWRPDPATA